MKVVAVDTRPNNPAMQAVRQKLAATPPAGWKIIQFNSAPALLAGLAAVNPAGNAFQKIEIVAEGSPLNLDAVEFQVTDPGYLQPAAFGNQLGQIPGMGAATIVYLSGCNTGLKRTGTALSKCIAQILANTSGAKVRGAAGYITGMHATKDEQCAPDLYGEPTYAGARQASGARCWNRFNPV